MPRSNVVAAALLTGTIAMAPSPAFACVVGNGTTASCTEPALDACLPGGMSFDGSVAFDCGGAATIDVTGTKQITADTSIDGGGVITISGGNTTQVFVVSLGVGFALAKVAIIDGSNTDGGGGAVYNYGTLTVTDGIFSHNSALGGGAILNGVGAVLTVINGTFSGNTAINGDGSSITNSGTLTVTHSTFSGGDGGAVFNLTTATVSDSSFSGNTTGSQGGGISNDGSLTVTDCTFSDNAAHGGGAISSQSDGATVTVTGCTFSRNSAEAMHGYGGAILNVAPLTVANCTFADNRAGAVDGYGGVIFNDRGTVGVTNSTFSGNAAFVGGIIAHLEGDLTVTNSILANTDSGGNCYASSFFAAVIHDGGHNIDDGTTCGFSGVGCSDTTGTSACSTNPMLDPDGLGDNGGPTQTIALQPGSPAIDGGDQNVCIGPPVNDVDQRGLPRPGSGSTNCSIGAYEFYAPDTTTTTTTSTTTSTATVTQPPNTTTSTTSTMAPPTTTTQPCTSAPCILDAAIMSPECAGQNIPARVTAKLGTAEALIDGAAITTGKKRRNMLRKARAVLRQAGAKVARAAKGTRGILSSDCARTLGQAIDGVRGGLRVANGRR